MVACDLLFPFNKGEEIPIYMASFETPSSVIIVPSLASIYFILGGFVSLDEFPGGQENVCVPITSFFAPS